MLPARRNKGKTVGRGQKKGKAVKKVKINKIVNTDIYYIPGNVTYIALNTLLAHIDTYSVPKNTEVHQRLINGGFPINPARIEGNEGVGDLEIEIPERRVVENFEYLVRAEQAENELDIADPSSYSNNFIYEIIHHLFYLKGDQKYLPFFGTTPNRDWLMNMLLGYDPQDKLTIRLGFDVEKVLRDMERLNALDANRINQHLPGLLRLPAAGNQAAFLNDLNQVLGCVRLMSPDVRYTTRKALKGMLNALYKMTIGLNETDFTLTQLYTHLVDLATDVQKNYNRIQLGVTRPSSLPLYLFASIDKTIRELLRCMPSKSFLGLDLVKCPEAEFLNLISKEAYANLKYCLGGAYNSQTFSHHGFNVNKDVFLKRHMREDALAIALSSTLMPMESTMIFCVENDLTRAEVSDIFGFGDEEFNRFCRRLNAGIQGTHHYLEALNRYCTAILDRHTRIKESKRFSFNDIVKKTFLLRYQQNDPNLNA